MRRRKNLRVLQTAGVAAALAAAAITIGEVSLTLAVLDQQTDCPKLEFEYIRKEVNESEPLVIYYETGTIERTHDIKVNEFSFEEAQELMRLAQAEAGNQGEDGMWLVMSTVINRRSDEEWPDSILEVINQHCKTKNGRTIYQFETVANEMIDKVEISQEAHNALARIEKGEVAPQIVAFERKDSDALDKYFTYAFTYKDHKFYTKK